jgi:NitT/TauT family transport system substrate-binding protein
MKIIVKLIIIAISITMSQVVYGSSKQPKKIRLVLQWSPQAQFAGYFVALEKGFYKKHGIDLTIMQGGPDKIVSDCLHTNKADFGTMFLTTALERRDAGIPLVNVGQFIHHSTLMLIAKAGEGIHTVNDLDQKKVSLWANEFQIQPLLLFKQLKINVEIIPQASSMDLFLRGAVSATSAMWYNEYHTILSSGYLESELQPFFFRDTDFDFPEDGIYCLEETLQRNPQTAKGLVNGTIEGWEYAFNHKEEALKIVARYMKDANLPVNKAHQRWMLQRMYDTLYVNGIIANNGILDRHTFSDVLDHLLQGNIISKPIKYDTFYQGPNND